MNLPQEYWEKQTLFEIASGLGTPVSIDDTTLNRRLGIFARVLIDVDLSENLFESVVVEREEHALSIIVQYEKHPSFCSHCRMIGHTIQNCSKLNAYNTAKAPIQKIRNAPAKTIPIGSEKKVGSSSGIQPGKHVKFFNDESVKKKTGHSYCFRGGRILTCC